MKDARSAGPFIKMYGDGARILPSDICILSRQTHRRVRTNLDGGCLLLRRSRVRKYEIIDVMKWIYGEWPFNLFYCRSCKQIKIFVMLRKNRQLTDIYELFF